MPRLLTPRLLLRLLPLPPPLPHKVAPLTSLEKTTRKAVASTSRAAQIAMRVAPSRGRRLRLLSGKRT